MGDRPDIDQISSELESKLTLPRLYQQELIEEAKKRNIIVRADTGTGKTLVALHLMNWVADQARSRSRQSIQAFLVPTRPLVFQQAAIIKSQTKLKVKAYTGDQQPEFWKIDKWRAELDGVDAIVCTAQIFLDLISKGFWDFEDVSLIVFDEAHHCRKKHIYNQIMQTHYHRLAKQPERILPKILGLTASPIWTCNNLEKAERDIHLTDNTQQNPGYPWEIVDLFLKEHGDNKTLLNCSLILEDLGIYAKTYYVVEWLKNYLSTDHKEAGKIIKLLDPTFKKKVGGIISDLEASIDPEVLPTSQISDKLKTLIGIFRDYLERKDSDGFCGIVFVKRRLHAQILSVLIMRTECLKQFIRPIALTGHGGRNTEFNCLDVGMDSRSQNKSVEKFRSGEYNLTIATNVAEEGLDFQACKVVIRFDEIDTWKGYVQSRGRARAQNSDFIVVLPKGTSSKYLDTGKRPEDEIILDGEADSLPQLICKQENGKVALLTHSAAVGLLNDVCSLIPQDDFAPAIKPIYITEDLPEGFISEVTLPPMASLPPSKRIFKGEPMPTKKDSRKSAAFEACKVLRSFDILDEHFLARRESKGGAVIDADNRVIVPLSLPEQVSVICTNPFGYLGPSSDIWLHKLNFDYGDLGTTTMGFLCAKQLTSIARIDLFDHHHGGRPFSASLEITVKLDWEGETLTDNISKLDKFTRTVLQVAVNRRDYASELLFMVAPLIDNNFEIDWELVEAPLTPIANFEELSKQPLFIAPVRALSSRIFMSSEACPHNFETAPSELTDGSLSSRFMKRISNFKSLRHFFVVYYNIKNQDLPNSELIYADLNFPSVDPFDTNAKEVALSSTGRTIIPISVCKATKIERMLWETMSILPAILRLLHDTSQANALFERFGLVGMNIKFGIEALTQPGIGMPWDYQTLETVGDAFLKLATSVHIYLIHSRKCEGDMSLLRSKSVDNSFLRGKAIQAQIGGFVLSQRYRTIAFQAPHLEDAKKLEDGRLERVIPRRVLSDVIEALMGAAFISGGTSLALKLGTELDLCFGGQVAWGERHMSSRFESDSAASQDFTFTEEYKSLERKIGYEFKEKLLLIQAVTHRSANSFLTNCYEREEWLGDAVIDMWVIEHVYKRFSNTTAEKLTLARARLVANGSLGFLALRKLGLHELILHQAKEFKVACERCLDDLSKFSTISEYYADITNVYVTFDPPKILNDALEAVVGAVFVDSGFDLPTVYRTLDLIFEEVLPGLAQTICHDPLSRLLRLRNVNQCTQLDRQNITLSEPSPDPNVQGYIPVRGCVIKFHGEVLAIGKHLTSSSVAEQRAALEAVKALEDYDCGNGPSKRSSRWEICRCKEIARIKASDTAAKANLDGEGGGSKSDITEIRGGGGKEGEEE
ncbi:hypothetical protein BY996DRAFT_2431069 [Phakopsora pachyrhizi]|nr:hypothetical protein BY996DRAFT_2431069 [Phakopsora pachyrhizi]